MALLRTSRFLPAAIDACRARWPGAEFRVVCQPGSEHECESRGLRGEATLVYDAAPRLRPWPLLRSRAGLAIRRWHPDAVVFQWSTVDGRGHDLLAWCALLTGARRIHALRYDGAWIDGPALWWTTGPLRRGWRRARARSGARLAQAAVACGWVARRGLVVLIALLAVLATPAWLVARARERCRLAMGWHFR